MTEVIAMKNLKKNFGNKTVLNELSCTIAENEIFGLLGPSGAGKTTIINILTGQIKKTDGEATVFGTETDNFTDTIYTSIGMVLDNAGSIFFADALSCNNSRATRYRIGASALSISQSQTFSFTFMI